MSKFGGYFEVRHSDGFDWEIITPEYDWDYFRYETYGRMVEEGKTKPVKILLSHPANEVRYYGKIRKKGGLFDFEIFPTKRIMNWLENGKGLKIQLPLVGGRSPVNLFTPEGFKEALAKCVKNPEEEYKQKAKDVGKKGLY